MIRLHVDEKVFVMDAQAYVHVMNKIFSVFDKLEGKERFVVKGMLSTLLTMADMTLRDTALAGSIPERDKDENTFEYTERYIGTLGWRFLYGNWEVRTGVDGQGNTTIESINKTYTDTAADENSASVGSGESQAG